MDRKKLFKRLSLLVVSIFLANFLAMQFHWYSSMWYFDILMHFLGGLWVGLFVFWLLKIKDISFSSVSKILFGVLIIGALWEIFEIVVNNLIAKNTFNVTDTVTDLIMDMIGGVVSIFYFSKDIFSEKADMLQ